MADEDRTVQVPASLPTREQIAEARLNAQALAQHVIDLMEDDDVTERVQADLATIERVLDSVSQPTPTAKTLTANQVVDGFESYERLREKRVGRQTTASPRIEDLAPGTRLAYIIPAIEEWAGPVISDQMEPPLREGVKMWPTMKAQGYSSAIDEVIEVVRHVIDGTYDLGRIDPSTIRDVTPPARREED